jgi:purine-cytosine permease-like protein
LINITTLLEYFDSIESFKLTLYLIITMSAIYTLIAILSFFYIRKEYLTIDDKLKYIGKVQFRLKLIFKIYGIVFFLSLVPAYFAPKLYDILGYVGPYPRLFESIFSLLVALIFIYPVIYQYYFLSKINCPNCNNSYFTGRRVAKEIQTPTQDFY